MPINQGALEKIQKEEGEMKNKKGAEKKLKGCKDEKHARDRGARGENMKGVGSKDPP